MKRIMNAYNSCNHEIIEIVIQLPNKVLPEETYSAVTISFSFVMERALSYVNWI